MYFKHIEKNIAMVRFKEDEVINLERSKEIVSKMETIMDISKNCYSIVDARMGSVVSERARTYFAKADEFKEYKKGIAVIISELPQRLIFNFYIRFNKPFIQHKSFNSIDKALGWFSKLDQDG